MRVSRTRKQDYAEFEVMITEWRKRQSTIPSISEAIRILVAKGLEAERLEAAKALQDASA